MPMVPVQAGPRSDRMSPNRFDATTTLKRVGLEHEQRRQDVDVELVPLDVGEVLRHLLHALVPVRHGDGDAVRLGGGGQMLLRRLAGELEGELQHAVDADAAHHRFLHDHLARRCRRTCLPPIAEYSPSVFSRTTQKSMSPGLRLASGDGTPGISRTGRRLTYWSNSRRNRMSEPHSEMWSGIFAGQPTAPKIDRVVLADLLLPVVRHHAF